MAVHTFIHKTMCSFEDITIACVLIRLHTTMHTFGQIPHRKNWDIIKVASKVSTTVS